MARNTLLFSRYPLLVDRRLAQLIGLNEAIVLQQVSYWLDDEKNHKVYEGRKWVYNSYPDWQKDNFPFWSIPTIQRTFAKLEMMGLLIIGNFNKMRGDVTKWYTIDEEGVEALYQCSPLSENPARQKDKKPAHQNDTPSYQNDTMDNIKMIRGSYQDDMTNTKDYTKTNTKTTTSKKVEEAKPLAKTTKPRDPDMDKICGYYAKAFNLASGDSLSSMDYKYFSGLVAEGFTFERVKPGIDEGAAQYSKPGKYLRSAYGLDKIIRQLDPERVKPANVVKMPVKSGDEIPYYVSRDCIQEEPIDWSKYSNYPWAQQRLAQ